MASPLTRAAPLCSGRGGPVCTIGLVQDMGSPVWLSRMLARFPPLMYISSLLRELGCILLLVGQDLGAFIMTGTHMSWHVQDKLHPLLIGLLHARHQVRSCQC